MTRNYCFLLLLFALIISCGDSNQLSTEETTLVGRESDDLLYLRNLKQQAAFIFEGEDRDTGDVCALAILSYQYDGVESIDNLMLNTKSNYFFDNSEQQSLESRSLFYYDDFTFTTPDSSDVSISLHLDVAEKIDSASSFSFHWLQGDQLHRKECQSLQFIAL